MTSLQTIVVIRGTEDLRKATNQERNEGVAGLVGCGNRAAQLWRGLFEIQHAGHELAERSAQMSQHALLERSVVLGAAKKIAEQLPEHRVALQKLHHARRDR